MLFLGYVVVLGRRWGCRGVPGGSVSASVAGSVTAGEVPEWGLSAGETGLFDVDATGGAVYNADYVVAGDS